MMFPARERELLAPEHLPVPRAQAQHHDPPALFIPTQKEIFSPHTTGDEWPDPGNATFHL